VMAKGRSFSLTQTQTTIDQSTYDDAQANGGWRSYNAGLKTVSLSVGNVYAITAGWQAILNTGGIIYIKGDVNIGAAGATVFRGMFMLSQRAQSGNQGDLEAETLTLPLYVAPGNTLAFPWQWYVTSSSTLNTAIQMGIQAYLNNSPLYIQYLPNGIVQGDGQTGQVIITESSMANAIDGINTFTFTFQGTEAPTAV